MPRLPHHGVRTPRRLPEGRQAGRTRRSRARRLRVVPRPRRRPREAGRGARGHDRLAHRQVRLLRDPPDLRKLPRSGQRPGLRVRGGEEDRGAEARDEAAGRDAADAGLGRDPERDLGGLAGARLRARRRPGLSVANVRSDDDARGVRTITIDRESRRNALDRATLDELEAALRDAASPGVRVVVLRGAGTQAFSAGADLKELLAHETLDDRRRHFDGVARVIRAMHELPAPVVARVQGFALAGGCGVAVAADFTIAAESAVFGLPEIGIGLLPMVVSAPILRATGSRKVVLDLVLSGRRVGAEEALRLGLASRVVPDARLDAEVDELAGQLASLSPAALRLGKEAIYAMAEMEYGAALRYLREMIVLTATTEDAREGISAFFEKREPRWTGR
ncbi:MAG: enoyl-CoA hydratase [Proteobacteria bacterium]|nr:MAG: enoyl-CoA hydratase [Pseudomonadota bacterium]